MSHKNCPFCGGGNVSHIICSADHYTYMQCTACGARGPVVDILDIEDGVATHEDAIAKWDTRWAPQVSDILKSVKAQDAVTHVLQRCIVEAPRGSITVREVVNGRYVDTGALWPDAMSAWSEPKGRGGAVEPSENPDAFDRNAVMMVDRKYGMAMGISGIGGSGSKPAADAPMTKPCADTLRDIVTGGDASPKSEPAKNPYTFKPSDDKRMGGAPWMTGDEE